MCRTIYQYYGSPCKARGLIKPRGTQRTDSTHVLAAVRTLHRLECVLETMHLVLNQRAQAAPHWVRQHVPHTWYDRYGLRADELLARLLGLNVELTVGQGATQPVATDVDGNK